jgi:hypothetical protein
MNNPTTRLTCIFETATIPSLGRPPIAHKHRCTRATRSGRMSSMRNPCPSNCDPCGHLACHSGQRPGNANLGVWRRRRRQPVQPYGAVQNLCRKHFKNRDRRRDQVSGSWWIRRPHDHRGHHDLLRSWHGWRSCRRYQRIHGQCGEHGCRRVGGAGLPTGSAPELPESRFSLRRRSV